MPHRCPLTRPAAGAVRKCDTNREMRETQAFVTLLSEPLTHLAHRPSLALVHELIDGNDQCKSRSM